MRSGCPWAAYIDDIVSSGNKVKVKGCKVAWMGCAAREKP